ncbi:hypothetical protein ES332_A10G139600v1 [Gossypium tomentosum]|uniref:Uncharacterized protein n=1 Tax=Gossypium tomentosum TaxID=34277 RepID=A0A5D2NSV2_GOSTO|nr:hypothetical protein ES332_A10G139600v1 [Gossypium tomentosum]
MIALEKITLPIPYLTTTPDPNLKSLLLKPTSKLILISSPKEGTHTSLVTSLSISPKGRHRTLFVGSLSRH